MSDSVVIDAKRILLRYGAPISVLVDIGEAERIELAREMSRTEVPDRSQRLQDLLIEKGYLDASKVKPIKSKKRRKK